MIQTADNVMLATGYNKKNIKFPCLLQTKLDGVRAKICLIGDEVHILSRTGKEYDVPHLKRWGEGHKDLLPLDGEIYNHRELTFQQICSAVKCKSWMTEKLRYVVYDKPVLGMNNKNRWAELVCDLGECIEQEGRGCVELCQTVVCHSYEDIERWHDIFVSQGYEGAIIRNMDGMYIEGRSNNLMKLKKFDTDEYEIIDVIEASGQDKGTAIFHLKAKDFLWTAEAHPKDKPFTFFARPVGSKEQRASYLREKEKLIGKQCTIRHFGYTDGGVIPRFPVALGIRDYE